MTEGLQKLKVKVILIYEKRVQFWRTIEYTNQSMSNSILDTVYQNRNFILTGYIHCLTVTTGSHRQKTICIDLTYR